MNPSQRLNHLVKATQALAQGVGRLRFGPPVTHVYNPLDYAWPVHLAYLQRFAKGRKRVVFLGMNPGPFGMAQTGIPFGEIDAVRDWLRLEGQIGKPAREHPQRKVLGFDCPRREVSGQRLWGLFADKFGTPEAFFADHFVLNYCPLAFLEESGKNRTPDKLATREKERLTELCDEYLVEAMGLLEPDWVIGVGDFAAKRAEAALGGNRIRFGRILHPSPASPAANRNWAAVAESQMAALGLWPAQDLRVKR